VTLLLWLVCGGIGLYGLHRLAQWMESRDWIYYQRIPKANLLGDSMIGLDKVLRPNIEHLQQTRQRRKTTVGVGDGGPE
jgi:hypothetical protein